MSRNQIRIEFTSKTPFAGGVSFGDTGPYERLLGMVSFAIDPNEKDLPLVVDLELAPRNAEGLVEFKAVLDIVKPVDLSRGNRRLLFDFSNRGNRGAFTRLNDGGGSDLSKRATPATAFSIGWGTLSYGAAGRATWFTPATISWPSCRKPGKTGSRFAAESGRNSSSTDAVSSPCP